MKEQSMILYDGHCGLCSRLVRFVIKRDPRKQFVFASLQSDTGKRIWQAYRGEDAQANRGDQETFRTNDSAAAGPDTFALLHDRRLYTKSTAGLLVLKHLRGPWPIAYKLVLVPEGIRDWIYDKIARHRYRFIRDASCPLYFKAASEQDRFIDGTSASYWIPDEVGSGPDSSAGEAAGQGFEQEG